MINTKNELYVCSARMYSTIEILNKEAEGYSGT
jgi:hypothetical protein